MKDWDSSRTAADRDADSDQNSKQPAYKEFVRDKRSRNSMTTDSRRREASDNSDSYLNRDTTDRYGRREASDREISSSGVRRRSFNPNFDHNNRLIRRDDDNNRSYDRESSSFGRRGYDRDGSYGLNSNSNTKGAYSERTSSYSGRSYGERGSYGERKNSYGSRRDVDRKGSYGDRSDSYGERGNSYGDRKPRYGESSSFGENSRSKSFSENSRGGYGKSYGENSGRSGYGKTPYGDNSFKSKSSYSENSGRGGYGKSAYGNNSYGKGARNKPSKYQNNKKYPKYDSENYPTFPVPVTEDKIRLNRYIAMSGICSRREADEYIQAGVVSVNGLVVTELGARVSQSDEIRFHGEVIKNERKVYILMNKPKGYVTSLDDPHADKTVMDLLKNGCRERVYPVGRLDKNSLGVLLITNDGDMAKKLMHPSYEKKKVYQVSIDKALTAADMTALAEGFELEDGEIHADSVSYVAGKKTEIGIEIHSGRNRIVRRMFEHLGYRVVKLDRVYFAGLTKKNLKRGEWRFLTPREVQVLQSGQYE